MQVGRVLEVTFSPLVIGAMAATDLGRRSGPRGGPFSPLVIGAMAATHNFRAAPHDLPAFSPLVIGAMAATCPALAFWTSA